MDKKGKIAKFVVLFAIYLILEYLFLYFFPEDFENWQRENIAKLLWRILSFLGVEVKLNGDTITFPTGAIKIVYECTGGFAFFIFSSAVLAYPASWKIKLLGQVFGFVTIFVLNMFRLIFISLILLKLPVFFDFVHKYLWQASFTVVVIFLFILWVEKWAGK